MGTVYNELLVVSRKYKFAQYVCGASIEDVIELLHGLLSVDYINLFDFIITDMETNMVLNVSTDESDQMSIQ